jgi:hypothetical protein
MTDDCPVGVAARVRRTMRRAVVAVAGLLGLGIVGGFIERELMRPRLLIQGAMLLPPPRTYGPTSGTSNAPTSTNAPGSCGADDAPVDSGDAAELK